MTMSSAEPFLHMSLREARQGDVAISALEWRRLLRFARNDVKELCIQPLSGLGTIHLP